MLKKILLALALAPLSYQTAADTLSGTVNSIYSGGAQNTQGAAPDLWVTMSSNPNDWVNTTRSRTAGATLTAAKMSGFGTNNGETITIEATLVSTKGGAGNYQLTSTQLETFSNSVGSVSALSSAEGVGGPFVALGNGYTLVLRTGVGAAYTNSVDIALLAAVSLANNLPLEVVQSYTYVWNAATNTMEGVPSMIRSAQITGTP